MARKNDETKKQRKARKALEKRDRKLAKKQLKLEKKLAKLQRKREKAQRAQVAPRKLTEHPAAKRKKARARKPEMDERQSVSPVKSPAPVAPASRTMEGP